MRDYTLQKLTFVLMAGFPGTGKTTLAAELRTALGFPVIDKDYLKESLLLAAKSTITEEDLGRAVYEIVFAFAHDILVRQQLSVMLDPAAIHPFILECAFNIACAAKDYLKEFLLLAATSTITEEELGRAVYEIVFDFARDILVCLQLPVILDTAALHPFILERAFNIACSAKAQLKIILCRADLNIRNERMEKRKSSVVKPHVDTTIIEDDLPWFKHLPKDILILCTAGPLTEYIHPTIEYLLA